MTETIGSALYSLFNTFPAALLKLHVFLLLFLFYSKKARGHLTLSQALGRLQSLLICEGFFFFVSTGV
jgi:hypothetical protein